LFKNSNIVIQLPVKDVLLHVFARVRKVKRVYQDSQVNEATPEPLDLMDPKVPLEPQA